MMMKLTMRMEPESAGHSTPVLAVLHLGHGRHRDGGAARAPGEAGAPGGQKGGDRLSNIVQFALKCSICSYFPTV